MISSNRALARSLGVSETAVRKAEKAGRIRRAGDGSWDLERVKAA
jgi:biotin operon repressor